MQNLIVEILKLVKILKIKDKYYKYQLLIICDHISYIYEYKIELSWLENIDLNIDKDKVDYRFVKKIIIIYIYYNYNYTYTNNKN